MTAALEFTMKTGVDYDKAAIGAELDALAKAHAAANKITFAKAYDAVLATDSGKALYAGYAAAPAPAVTKAAPAPAPKLSDPEIALNVLAKTHAAEAGVSFHKAYVAVLQSPVGRELYAETRA